MKTRRLLIYSHDSFGLGHLRRCRTLAHALVDAYKDLTVLILTGSPIIGRFDFKARVDFVRIPGVIKLHNGDYTSLALHIDLADTLALRESIILHTTKVFAPDLFLVDKEPLGLKGEVHATLRMLRDKPTRTVLGLRDVMDAPELLADEWRAKGVFGELEALYDEYWVYGPRAMGNPLRDLPLDPSVEERMRFTGYLRRDIPAVANAVDYPPPERPYLLVTPGGGGDGIEMIDWVLRAYESGATLPWRGLFVLGPFMPQAERAQFMQRAEKLDQVDMITFDAQLERLMANASGVVAMGGYNTFCEILSLNRPALILPRSHPRREQLIRARNAARLDLVSILDSDGPRSTEDMVAALQRLPQQPPPSVHEQPGWLDGLDQVIRRVGQLFGEISP
ncbi:membrane protein [Marinobacterium nitratireducens]|uniref:Membrane protein n=1 Tax=Marinobacterium nitratireducens TaxID=518897 RepID=A0A917ZFF2_9GAMM|nr:glycosyltransferase [Marinobacterium nitratireducens]GGO81079.1 membrane protein [Marinobacterium nitratireducens]